MTHGLVFAVLVFFCWLLLACALYNLVVTIASLVSALLEAFAFVMPSTVNPGRIAPKRRPHVDTKHKQQTSTSGGSVQPGISKAFERLQEEIDIPDNDAPLSNGVFRRAFSQVFSMLFQHCTELTNSVAELKDQNKQLKADVQSQQVEIQLLRRHVTSLASALHSTGVANTSSNVLIHGIPESPSETLFDLNFAAMQQLRKLDPDVVVNPTDILTVDRLGLQCPAASNRQRPLVVKLKSSRLSRQVAKASFTRYMSNKEAFRDKPYMTLHATPGAYKPNHLAFPKLKSPKEARSGGRLKCDRC